MRMRQDAQTFTIDFGRSLAFLYEIDLPSQSSPRQPSFGFMNEWIMNFSCRFDKVDQVGRTLGWWPFSTAISSTLSPTLLWHALSSSFFVSVKLFINFLIHYVNSEGVMCLIFHSYSSLSRGSVRFCLAPNEIQVLSHCSQFQKGDGHCCCHCCPHLRSPFTYQSDLCRQSTTGKWYVFLLHGKRWGSE